MYDCSRWPRKHSFVLSLSHDVDRVSKRWQYIYYALESILNRRFDRFKANWKSLLSLIKGVDPYWNFEEILLLESSLGVRSTFFFLDERGRARLGNPRSLILFWGRYSLDDPRIINIIKSLDSNGWEIALHGSYNSYNQLGLLTQEKNKIEAILGHPVRGVRQHYLNLEVPTTWQIHTRLGFRYDSTLGFTGVVGFRWNACSPFYPMHPLTGKKIPVLQIPLAIMDGPLMRYEDPWAEVTRLIDQAEAVGGVLTVNFHQRVFNPWELEKYQEIYIRIIRECQKRGAWVATLGEVAEWWEYHHAR